MMRNGTRHDWNRLAAWALAAALAGGCAGEAPEPIAEEGAVLDQSPGFPAPTFHHIRVNSVDPERALDWWETFWPAGRRTTVAGLPAFEADGVYLLYNTVDEPAPGAFDPERRQSVPQSAFWTTGPSTDGLALYERLTALDPEPASGSGSCPSTPGPTTPRGCRTPGSPRSATSS